MSVIPSVAGVGVDVVHVPSFVEQLSASGTRFAQAFTAGERRASRGADRSLAARWAAKEAVLKAWSSARRGHPESVDPESVRLSEIEVRGDAWGRPSVRLHGVIADALEHDLPHARIHLSLSHDADTATAFVVIEAGADVED